MTKESMGNLLMVANYPSDTAYAWWLMESFWLTLADNLAQHNRKAFLSYPKITSLSSQISDSDIITTELVVPWKTPEQKKQFKAFIKENNITSIYFTDQPYFSLKYIMMRLMGIKTIVTHDHTPGDRPPIRGIRGIIKSFRNKFSITCADKVFCLSPHMRNRSIDNERIPAKKCIVIQNGIPPVQCKPETKEPLKNQLNIKNNEIVICTSARAHPYKRLDLIIDCAHHLTKQAPDSNFIFLIIGDGPSLPDLQKKIDSLKLNKHVSLLGFRKDVHDILCASDIAIHAALGEGFSLSILEYMSASLPVLVPDIPSVTQAITDGESGLIFSKNSPEDAALHMKTLIENPDAREKMGKTAKSTANKKYNLENCLSTLKNEASNIF